MLRDRLCKACGFEVEEWFRASDDISHDCDNCGGIGTFIIVYKKFPSVHEDIRPYRSTLTNEWITSRSKHREHLNKHDAYEIGNEKPQAVRDWEDKQKELPPEKRAVGRNKQPIVK